MAKKSPKQSADDQAAVFAFLGDPNTHGGAKVERFETHGAAVFLAGDRAIKVKRAVRYPFLDYSTLAKRKAACQAELDVNRNFAPQLYRRIVPITRAADGSLALGGAGETVEWAVEMTRFDENGTLDRLAERGEIDDVLAGKIAVAVAAMHERAQPADAAAWIGALEGFVRNTTAIFGKHRDLFAEPAVARLERQSLAALARLRPLLVARGKAGLIRRGHGDLHLGNIAVLDGEPIAFDALEFDAVIASGDVLYDLAFLLMDLVEAGQRRAANLILNGYFAAARRIADCDGIAALTFFMSLRAAIRAMTTASRLDLAKAAVAQSAKRYFDLALELLAPAKPTVVATGGLSGTGKSALAGALAPELLPIPGALVLRSDVERKALHGVAEHARLPGEAYRAEVTERVYGILTDKAARVARAGHCVVADAVFARPQERAAIEAAAAAAGADFFGLFLTADLRTRLDRVGARQPDASDADAVVAHQQEDFDVGAVTWTVVDASGPPERTLAEARAALKQGARGNF
jgi:aminoglycoside phosphotransferase family enzyme/predicted kinase